MQASHMSSKMRKQRAQAIRHAGHAGGHSSPRLTTDLDVRIGVFRQPAMQTPVLVLNASYEPINICGARRALGLGLECGAGFGGDAERDPATGISQNSTPDTRAFAEEHSAARPELLPVLRHCADR